MSACANRILDPITHTDQSELIYLFESVKIDQRPALQVDLIFRGNASGESQIVLPESAVHDGHVDRNFKNLEPLTPGSRLFSGSDSRHRKVIHVPGEVVHVRYNWVSDPSQSQTALAQRFDERPVIDSAYFAFSGKSALARPEWPQDRSLQFSVRWLKPPEGWVVLGRQGESQELQNFSGTFADLNASVFFSGDFRLDRQSESKTDSSLVVAIRGQWPFPDATAFEAARDQWKKLRTFWGADSYLPSFLVFLKSNQDCCHFQGTAAFNSYVVTASVEEGWGPSIRELLNDELFFYPIRKKYKIFSSWSFGLIRFFSRAFDLQKSQMPYEEWLKGINQILTEQAVSPARGWSEALLRTRASEPWVRRQYYLRPDYFMQRVLMDWLKSGRTVSDLYARFKEVVLTSHLESFDEALLKQLEIDLKRPLRTEWRKQVIEADLSHDDSKLVGGCIAPSVNKQAVFDLGFDWERSKIEKRIRGLTSNTEVARAGLKNGQTLLRWKILMGDADASVEIWIREKHEEKYLRFLPRSSKRVPVSHFDLQEGESTVREKSLQCLSRLGLDFSSITSK